MSFESSISVLVALVLEVLDHRLEGIVIFAVAFLHAHDHVAIHLDETAVAIPREALVVRRVGPAPARSGR